MIYKEDFKEDLKKCLWINSKIFGFYNGWVYNRKTMQTAVFGGYA